MLHLASFATYLGSARTAPALGQAAQPRPSDGVDLL